MTDQDKQERHIQAPTGGTPEAERKRMEARTEAEARSIDGKAGQSGQSSHNDKSHHKAGSMEGAGGGKKQQRSH